MSKANGIGAIYVDGDEFCIYTWLMPRLWMRQVDKNAGYKPALVCVRPRLPVPFGLSVSKANGICAINFDGDEFCIHTRLMPRLWRRQADKNAGYKPALVCVRPRLPVPFGLSLSKANGIGAIYVDGD